MIVRIETAEALRERMERGEGYLYNDFGGRDPRMCPIHAMRCRWIATMLKPPSGRLGVPKLCSDDFDELVGEIERLGKVWAICGSEPALRGGAPKATASPETAVPRLGRPLTPTAVGSSDATSRFTVTRAENHVRVRSECRLQFDSKPGTRALKQAIGDAVRELRAPAGHILEAIYTSASTESVDAENVLLYNVDTGRFAACTAEGLRFERVHAMPADGSAHAHDYRIVPLESRSTHWRELREVVRILGMPLPALSADMKPDGIWLAVREHAPADARVTRGAYGLELTLTRAAHARSAPVGLLKPLIDGVVAGLESHNGQDLETVSAVLAARLGIEGEIVSAHLMDHSRAWLGIRRLLHPRAGGVQWAPGDDACVSATLRVKHGTEAIDRLDVCVALVEPLTP